MVTTGRCKAPGSPRRRSYTNVFILFGTFHTSLRLPLWLALCEGHMYCLRPLQNILLVCTTLVCVLFVATPTYTMTVYYFSTCTVCGHSHIYNDCVLLLYVYCLWPLPCTLILCTTLVCALFVATPTYTITVYYFSMCTDCSHSHLYY